MSELELQIPSLEAVSQAHKCEYEENLIATCLKYPQLFCDANQLLSPEMFWARQHQEIWKALAIVSGNGAPSSTDSLKLMLLEHLGNEFNYRSMLDDFSSVHTYPHSEGVSRLAEIIKSSWARRQYASILLLEAPKLLWKDSRALKEADSALQATIFALMQRSEGISVDNCALVRDCIDDLEAELKAPDKGVLTGLLDLDAMLSGFRPGSLNVVGARTAIGKTTIALWIALQVAKNYGPAVYFSREIDKRSLAIKALSAESQTNCFSRTAAHNIQALSGHWDELSKVPLYLDDSPRLTTADISSRLRQISRHYQAGLAMVVVDYIQLMATSATDQVAELDSITVELRAIAREFGLPVLALAQINRGVESRADKRPTLADIRSSGAIEQNADTVIGLYREDYYNPETSDKDITELIVLKNRYGPTGTAKVLHQLEYGGYFNLLRGSSL